MEPHYQYVSKLCRGKNLIVIQDTTQLNYEHHSGLIDPEELGLLGDNKSRGLHVHPCLVMDADQNNLVLGYSHFKIHNRSREIGNKHERIFRNQPLEEKESYRWVEEALSSKQNLADARSVIFVSDRESDMYAIWSQVPDHKTHLVIRARSRRAFELENEEGEIIKTSTLQTILGYAEVKIKGGIGKKDKARTAKVEIKGNRVEICKRKTLKSNTGLHFAKKIALYAVEVTEIVPEGTKIEEPLHWMLLTDMAVEDLSQALSIISIYKSRWNIEQLFRLVKQKGFRLEDSQLETARALQNLIAMVFIAASRVLQFVKGRELEDVDAEDFFTPIQKEVLEKSIPMLEGKTDRSKNKYKPHSLAYYIWVIARMGSWKPEDRDPPGPITMLRGWKHLHFTIKGYLLK